MPKVLIVGGAGFIGSNLARELLNRGDEVIAVDNLITGDEHNIEELKQNPKFRFINFDVIQPLDPILDQLSGVTQIYHLASPASPNAKSEKSYIAFPIETLLVNSVGTKNLLDFANKNNARILFASTSEVYGDPAVSPQPETYWGNVNPNGVRSVYDESKRFGEAIVMAYKRKFDLDVRIIRIFNTYGPLMQKDDGRVVSNFINQALEGKPLTIYGDGTQTRSFCYVSDLVDGIVKVMNKDGESGVVVNLGNQEELTIKQIAEKVLELTGSASTIEYEEMPPDDPKQRRPDLALAREKFGFNPYVTPNEGIQKTIEYFRGKDKVES